MYVQNNVYMTYTCIHVYIYYRSHIPEQTTLNIGFIIHIEMQHIEMQHTEMQHIEMQHIEMHISFIVRIEVFVGSLKL